MNKIPSGIVIAGFVVCFWAWVFALLTDSPALETMVEWLVLFTGFVLLLLMDKAFTYFELKREQRLHEEEK